MSQVNFKLMVDLDEAKQIIKAVGDQITPIIISEPGVGKTSILKALQEEMGDDYDYIYVDCPVKDMMDIAASIPNHETKSLEYYVSSLFKLGNGKKKCILLDEVWKAPKMMQIIYTRLMLERYVGDEALPEGSIVFGTSNNASDGVGDTALGHILNRVMVLHLCKATADQWNQWATKNGVARPIRAWAAMNPKAFKSYLDPDQQDNPFIFKPSSTTKSFVSPRSLAKCSPIVENRKMYSENAMMAALAGTAGEAFAKSIAAFIAVESNLIYTKDVLKQASTIPVPDNISVLVMMMFEAVDTLDTQDNLNKYMDFVNRIPSSEVQTIFFTMIMRNKPKLGRYNQQINDWAAANHQLM
jgi:hypothetical protein